MMTTVQWKRQKLCWGDLIILAIPSESDATVNVTFESKFSVLWNQHKALDMVLGQSPKQGGGGGGGGSWGGGGGVDTFCLKLEYS